MLAARIYAETHEIDARLVPFGVTRQELIGVVRGVVGARADAVENDPMTAEGQLHLRHAVCPQPVSHEGMASAPRKQHRIGISSRPPTQGHLSERRSCRIEVVRAPGDLRKGRRIRPDYR